MCKLLSPCTVLDCHTGIALPVCARLASVVSPHWETQHHAVLQGLHLFQCKTETKWVPSLHCCCCSSLAYKLQQRWTHFLSIFFWAEDFLEMAAQLCSHAPTAAFYFFSLQTSALNLSLLETSGEHRLKPLDAATTNH